MSEREIPPDDRKDEWWVCACVKRDRNGNLTHIRRHRKIVKKCRKCGITQKEATP